MAKVLVIEDEAETRNIFLECLQAQGFDVIGAENGIVGVLLAREYLPDLIISDIIMPELNGYGVLRALREKKATAIIPLIFVTDKATRADIRKGMELGADDYLTKPCTPEELLRAIRARLERQTILWQWYATKLQSVTEPPLADTTRPTVCEFIFPSDPQLSEVFCFIEANYHQPITLSNVAQAVGYSSAYLTNLVRRQTGQTVQGWIVQRRMAAARFLLLLTSQRVEEIATRVGYYNPANFFRQFRQYHETTPCAWRKQHRNNSHLT